MAVEDLSLPSSEICTVPSSESPEPDVELGCLQKKKRHKKKTVPSSESPEPDVELGCSQKKKTHKKKKCKLESNDKCCESASVQSQVAQLSDEEAPQPLGEKNTTLADLGSPQKNSLSRKMKKTRKTKGCEASETNDTGCESPSLQPQLVQLSDQQAPQPLTEEITRITDSESPQSNGEMSLSQNKKRKKKKRKKKGSPETNDKSCESSSVQPQLVQVTDQKLEVPQTIEDLSFTVESKKRNGKKSRKSHDCKDEVCGASVGAYVMKSNMPAVDPCVHPSVEMSFEQLVAEPPVEVIGTTTNSKSPKPNADFGSSQEMKKKKRKKNPKTNDNKVLPVETMMPEDNPSFHPSLVKVSEQGPEVLQPLSLDVQPLVERTKKKKRKRESKTIDGKKLLVEVIEPEADPSLQPLLAIFSEDDLEEPPQLNTDAEPLAEGLNTTINSESTKSNEDINCSQETKKKNRKRERKTIDSKELLVKVMEPEADPPRQPLLAISSEDELEVPPLLTKNKNPRIKRKSSKSNKLSPDTDPSPQPTLSVKELEVPQPLNTDAETLVEGMSAMMYSESPKTNADFSCPQETKKKNRKRKCKANDSKELLMDIMTPETDPSLQATHTEKELEVPQPLSTGVEPLVEGMSTMMNLESPKLTADLSCPQETKKRNRKRKRKIRESKELSVEIMTPEADLSLQPSLSHLSPKAETEVVAIGGQGILQIPNSLPEKSLLNCFKKKLLILDINGLLADIVQMDVSFPRSFIPDKIISRKAVFKRPFCDSFLQFCFDKFNVGVWSSRTKINVDSVIDFLLGHSKHKLLFCWNQSHCTPTSFNTMENRKKPLVLKELRKLWEKLEHDLPWARGEYDENNTVLVDDSPYKALRNPVNTAIFPFPYQFRNRRDSSLGPGGNIRSYLQGLAGADSVQKYVEQNPFGQQPITESDPSWDFYRRVIEDVKPQT